MEKKEIKQKRSSKKFSCPQLSFHKPYWWTTTKRFLIRWSERGGWWVEKFFGISNYGMNRKIEILEFKDYLRNVSVRKNHSLGLLGAALDGFEQSSLSRFLFWFRSWHTGVPWNIIFVGVFGTSFLQQRNFIWGSLSTISRAIRFQENIRIDILGSPFIIVRIRTSRWATLKMTKKLYSDWKDFYFKQ